MNSRKVIILKLDKESVFMRYIQSPIIENIYIRRISSFDFFMKVLRKIKFDFLLYGNWKKNIKTIDTVIIFDNGYHSGIAKYIKKKNHNCKIIFYYWNIINEYNIEPLTDSNIDEVWTFDKDDSEKYSINYNPQFYTKNLFLRDNNIESDILFLGRDKGRSEFILELQEFCLKQGIKTEFIIVQHEKDLRTYQEYLSLLERNNCILDILAEGQQGMTLRVMESLFLNKKLITNNRDIINYDFYCKENIFILGYDNLDNLLSFIKGGYKMISDEIINRYDYETWLKRFL